MSYPNHFTIIIEAPLIEVLRIHDIPEQARQALDVVADGEEACGIFRYPHTSPAWLADLKQVLIEEAITWYMYESHSSSPFITLTSWNRTYSAIPPRTRRHTRVPHDPATISTPAITADDVRRAERFALLGDYNTESAFQLLIQHLKASMHEHHKLLPSWDEIKDFESHQGPT